VELVHLYRTFPGGHPRLCDAAAATSTRRARSAQQRPKQRQHRLSQAEVVELIAAYRERKSIKEVAQRYEVHRSTVAPLLGRHNVRQTG
jgi:hypothetical protein